MQYGVNKKKTLELVYSEVQGPNSYHDKVSRKLIDTNELAHFFAAGCGRNFCVV